MRCLQIDETTLELNSNMEDFYLTSSGTPLSSGHRFYGMKLQHTRCLLGLNRHITAMATIALLVAIIGVTTLLPHGTEKF
jgi:hypothetical protein